MLGTMLHAPVIVNFTYQQCKQFTSEAIHCILEGNFKNINIQLPTF